MIKVEKAWLRFIQVVSVNSLVKGRITTGNGEIDITQKASIPVIDSNNLKREALHTKLRKRFHLEPLKQLIEQGYISDCVIIAIRQAIERLEADSTASRKKEDNPPKLTAFYMSSTCSNSKKLNSVTGSVTKIP